MAASSSSSSSTIGHPRKYGVFLSFRGTDTRLNFVSHLYDALCRRGIPTFLDNEELHTGEQIWKIFEAIQDSNIAVVVFSQNYADSTFCLDELSKIMETPGMVVLPVFYGVDPDEVKSQTGRFGRAFVRITKKLKGDGRSRVMKWRTALTEAANLSGWDSKIITPESALVQQIVEDISKKLGYLRPDDFKGLFGMEYRIEHVESLLRIQSSETRVVGIFGMGGIGKTTLANCVFKRNSCYFQGSSCFLKNVREESQRWGLPQLQRNLLSEVFGKGNTDLNHLRHRKVFIVLDDLDKYTQFEELIGGPDFVGKGSKIIVTSRDRSLLNNIADRGCVFHVPILMGQDASQLFCSFAFKEIRPVDDFVGLSNKVVRYAKGNPLALKVLGLFLHAKTKQDWESTLKKVKVTMKKDIQETLRISYDGLDSEEKEVFLHISCFFKGMRESLAEEILDACDFSASASLTVLSDKALIERRNGCIEMHDLLQEMGREIVRQECVGDPGKWSRLWDHNDINRVFTENIGTRTVRGIVLDVSATSGLSLAPAVFSSMNRIELLKFYGHVYRYDQFFDRRLESQFKELLLCQGLESLPSSLRYLYWECYPLDSLPSNFCPENLVIIDMPCSKVERLWSGKQNLVNLKVIRLRRCRNLMEMPDLSSARNLVTIDCAQCESLREVPPSISFLEKLEELVFLECTKIESFPSTKHLRSLKMLDLNYCSALSIFPEVSVNVKCLYLAETAIEEVPESIRSLSQLEYLNLRGCRRLGSVPAAAVCELKSLRFLSIGPTIDVENLNTILSSLPLLYELGLDGDSFDALPTSITQLSRLQRLTLISCRGLKSLPNLPPCLGSIRAVECPSLKTVPRLSFQMGERWELDPPYHFLFSNCLGLDHYSCRNILKLGQQAIVRLANAVNRHPNREILRKRDEVIAVCPGSEIPQWFTTQKSGSVINVDLPSGWYDENFLGFSLCAVIDSWEEAVDQIRVRWKCQFGSNHGVSVEAYEDFGTVSHDLDCGHVFMFYTSYFHRMVTTDSGNQWCGNNYNNVSFEVFAVDVCEKSCYRVERCAVRLLYTGDSEDHVRAQPIVKRKKRIALKRRKFLCRGEKIMSATTVRKLGMKQRWKTEGNRREREGRERKMRRGCGSHG